MLQLGLAYDCCEAMHVQLAMMQIALCAYNANSQLVSSIQGQYICREFKSKKGYASWHGKSVLD